MATPREIFALIVFSFVLTPHALAQRGIGTLEGEEGPYKGTTNAFGDRYALDGPTIRVFSSNGKRYHFVGNDNENLGFRMRVRAQCALGWKGRTARAGIGDQRVEVEADNRWRNVAVEIPYTQPSMPRTPVQACNREIDKRMSQGLSRNELISEGFVVRYDTPTRAVSNWRVSRTRG